MFEEDYIKRLIQSFGEALTTIAKGKKNAIEDNIDGDSYDVNLSEDEMLDIMIKKHLSDGKVNEAENMLFDAIKARRSPRNLETAMYFYDELNKWDEDKLASCNFSKQEIAEGLKDVKEIYEKQGKEVSDK